MSEAWIQTFTGKQFFPFKPRKQDVCIEDIAHALSNICRFGGHSSQFYSVAEHCVYASIVAPEDFALQALLHDAPEAYLMDLPSPIKTEMPCYKKAEIRILRIIEKALKVQIDTNPRLMHKIDNLLLSTEAYYLHKRPPKPWNVPVENKASLPRLMCWTPYTAEKQFLTRYRKLKGELKT